MLDSSSPGRWNESRECAAQGKLEWISRSARRKNKTPGARKCAPGRPVREKRKSDAEDGFSVRRRRMGEDMGRAGGHHHGGAGRQLQPCVGCSGSGGDDGMVEDRGQFAAHDATIGLDAGLRDGMHAAFMRIAADRGLAGSIRQHERGYQHDSDTRATKHAVHHVLRVAPGGRESLVMKITQSHKSGIGLILCGSRDLIATGSAGANQHQVHNSAATQPLVWFSSWRRDALT